MLANNTSYSKEFANVLKNIFGYLPDNGPLAEAIFKVDGNNLERAYKDHLSGFRNWEQASHAENWVLHPENIGKRLGIDKTMLYKDLMTFSTNKEGHGKRHTFYQQL